MFILGRLSLSLLSLLVLGTTTCIAENSGMSLSHVVQLALEHNRLLKQAKYEQQIQASSLEVAEDFFVPHLTIQPGIEHAKSLKRLQHEGTLEESQTQKYGGGAAILWNIKTGGRIQFNWLDEKITTDQVYLDGNRVSKETEVYNHGFEVTFSQPLLKGAGFEIAKIPLRMAFIQKETSLLRLKQQTTELLTQVILGFRQLLQAKERIVIEESSLARAEELLLLNQGLIDAGRLPKVEIVQSETDVSIRKINLLRAQNAFMSGQMALAKQLDLTEALSIIPEESFENIELPKNTEKLIQLALENRPDHLIHLYNLELANLDRRAAEDERLWDLSFISGYRAGASNGSNPTNVFSDKNDQRERGWHVGLGVTHTFGDASRDQRYQVAHMRVTQAQIAVAESRESIRLEIKDKIREIQVLSHQLELAKNVRALTEKKLQIEQEKLKVGRSSNFQVVTFQNELIKAQNDELNARISYYNAMNVLDQSLGTTLQTWNVDIRNHDESQ